VILKIFFKIIIVIKEGQRGYKMTEYKLKADKRTAIGKKSNELRTMGIIPGILYGKGKSNENVQVDQKAFNRVFRVAGENSLIELEINGVIKNVLAHEVQINPVTDDVIHIDFYEVRMNEKIETEVPLKFIGESPAVKDLDGTLITNKDHIEVKCLPGNIPHEIEVDISSIITFEDSITAKDLKIPTNVELMTDPDETIILVNPPRSEEELSELESEIVENVADVEATAEKKEEEVKE